MNPSKNLHKHLYPGSENLKVLHIGNIANNGYNIANLLNQAGIKSDLIIGPYYHIAGCPEWEDSEFEGDVGDQFFPAWHKVKITNGFQRPRWAAQGPWELCLRYLLHRNKGNILRARICWYWLEIFQYQSSLKSEVVFKVSSAIVSPQKILYHLGLKLRLLGLKLSLLGPKLSHLGSKLSLLKYHTVRLAATIVKWLLLSNFVTEPIFYRVRAGIRKRKAKIDNCALYITDSKGSQLQDNLLESNVGDRSDRGRSLLEYDELASYVVLAEQLKPLFEFYDVVIGYSTDGIWPLLAGKKYIAYEHGTIRTLPFEDSFPGELCATVYQQADEVIISNFDNNKAAEKLGLERYTCIPHYINEMDVPADKGANIRTHLAEKYDADFIIYNPSRQHWSKAQDKGWEKGNDIFIRGFAEFVEKVNPKGLVVMTHWGESVEKSKELINALGFSDRVEWVEPVPHKEMIEYIQASDIVSDQFLLGTFGGIPAKAFMHGRPVLSSFEPEIHEWCFSSMPPFLPARNQQEIISSLRECYQDKEFYKSMSNRVVDWYKKEHSNRVLLNRMSKVLAQCSSEMKT